MLLTQLEQDIVSVCCVEPNLPIVIFRIKAPRLFDFGTVQSESLFTLYRNGLIETDKSNSKEIPPIL